MGYNKPETLKKYRETHKEQIKEYVETHREEYRRYQANYRKKHLGKIREIMREWRERNPEKIKAEQFVNNNHLPLAEFCELCPQDDLRKATEHHHPDYDYREIFVSVCVKCHKYIGMMKNE